VKATIVLGLPVYASLPDKADEMKAAGISVDVLTLSGNYVYYAC